MKTVLLVELADDGSLRISSDQSIEPRRRQGLFEEAIVALRDTSWDAIRWIEFLNAAQLLIEEDVSQLIVPHREWDDDDWEADECVVPEDSFSPEEKADTGQDALWPKPTRWWQVEPPKPDPVQLKKTAAIREALLEWRKNKSLQLGIPDYQILRHVLVENIANAVPLTERDLLKVRFYGLRTHERYGEELLPLLTETAAKAEAEALAEMDTETVAEKDAEAEAMTEIGMEENAGTVDVKENGDAHDDGDLPF